MVIMDRSLNMTARKKRKGETHIFVHVMVAFKWELRSLKCATCFITSFVDKRGKI